MTKKNKSGVMHPDEHKIRQGHAGMKGLALALTLGAALLPQPGAAQSYTFNSVSIEGNQRVDPGTILTYAGIGRGQTVSAADLNDAYQRVLASGLFESVEIVPQGGQLVIRVREYPTINQINFEGNRRLKDEELAGFIQSKSRLVFSPTTAERDAAVLTEAYSQNGRIAARVTPRIIRRSDNRVDLVFEIFEGDVVEIERLSFVGNRAFSDARLRRVLETKQAGLLRLLIKRDTFVPDRIEFDKRVLRDFYLSRGYVDFRTTGVNAELARERDGYFITFNVQEGQQFRFGQITTRSEIPEADAAEFQAALRLRPGAVYSPALVENNIARLERLANRKGYDFVRVEPVITRNDRELTLDVEFVLSRGPRIFVERIDIEGNTTTLDQVVRRQFKIVEGDPFNPREIRESAERIRALGYFGKAEVNAREGSSPDQVVVDVDLEETTTGSLSFGGTYSSNNGFGLAISFKEDNFLGRGQKLALTVSGADTNREYSLRFTEPAFLGRDLRFDFDIGYRETTSQFSNYDSNVARFNPAFTFPVSENGRFSLNYEARRDEMTTGNGNAGPTVTAEIAEGALWSSSVGYNYTFDSRLTGLNPNAGVLLSFGQDFAGLGGDTRYVKTQARAIAQTKVLNEEVTLRATVEGGVLHFIDGNSRTIDRYRIGSSVMRGFAPDGIGPRQGDDALGGNMYAVAKFEAEFPLGLPEEYGIRGGVFYDIGSSWGLDRTVGAVEYEDFSARQVVGLSLFWDTPVGPLRFDWSTALRKEPNDIEQEFNLSIATSF